MTDMVLPEFPAGALDLLLTPCCRDRFEPTYGRGAGIVGVQCENCGSAWNEYGEPLVLVR